MCTFVAFAIANVANVLTQNLGIPMSGVAMGGGGYRNSYAIFVTTCVLTTLGASGVLALLLLYMRHKRMLCY